jgi:hypothetical protein
MGLYYFRNRWYAPMIGGVFAPEIRLGTKVATGGFTNTSSPAPYPNSDPAGEVPVETVADVCGIGYDCVELCREPSFENAGYLCWSVCATVIPYVPGSWVARCGKQGMRCSKNLPKPKPKPKPKPEPKPKPKPDPKKPKPRKGCHCNCPPTGNPPGHCPKSYRYSFEGKCTRLHHATAVHRANADAGEDVCNNPSKGYRIKHCKCRTQG